MPHTLKTVDARYGAPMGRMGAHADTRRPYRFSLRRVRLDAGGYDSGGAYWGHGQPLYWASAVSGDAIAPNVDYFFRACDRDAARARVLADYPRARFYR